MGRVCHVELGPAVETGVDKFFPGKLFKICFINCSTFTLIRNLRIVPGEAQPFQIGKDLIRKGAGTTDGIQIFNS